MDFDAIRQLVKPAETKILLLVMDGVGGLPMEVGGQTELEAANTPNLDDLADRGLCGLQEPVGPGITPGSGPGHLALFGYDPIKYQVGRGVLAALGIDFDLRPGDVAARGNFCTIDDSGRVTDRRAGRISSDLNRQLCERLRKIDLPGVELFVQTVKEYRFLLVLRGDGLSPEISDSDPQEVGVEPNEPQALSSAAEKTAGLVKKFVDQARDVLSDQHPANMVLLRGFSKHPDWPQMGDVFKLKAAAIAGYPMYRGVSKLVGMQAFAGSGEFDDHVKILRDHWQPFDYVYLHAKKTDSAGEDGDFDRKVALIEEADNDLPQVLELRPDVIIVTGDHSTPAKLKYHSWHPVPVVLWSEHCRPDEVKRFAERACMGGGLGPRIPATDLMPIALANAGRLEKFGA